MIQTVTGKIDAAQMGCTMAHEHLCVDLSRVRHNDDSTFGYSELVKDEILKAKELGVQTIIEVSCNDMGRDVVGLEKLSRECGIYVIASTGFYLDEYHSQEIRQASISAIAEIFIHDLTVGMDGTSVKAGVIGEVASSEIMTESERKVLTAAAYAARDIGCAVTTHCQMGKLGEVQAAIFKQAGTLPEKVVLGHIDLSDDIDYMRALIESGFNIAFDTIGKESYLSDDKRAKNLKQLIEMGYVDHIVLSQDISRKSYFSNTGKFLGYTAVLKGFVPKLLEIGVKKEDIMKMLVSNPQHIFDIA